MSQVILLTIIFQFFCFYHIYSRKNEGYWYFIILLFPLIGAVFYFIHHLNKKRRLEMASEPISNFPEEAPEPEIIIDEDQFSDTVSNKIRLADRYMEKGNYTKAIEWYKSCMEGIYADDEELNKKLLQAYFSNEDYLNTILLGDKLNNERFFQNSQEKIAYAWAYFELHDDVKAEQIFEEMNLSNTNYQHRTEYAKFLIESDQFDKARSLLAELENEIDHMDEFEKNLLSKYILEIEAIHRTLSSSNK